MINILIVDDEQLEIEYIVDTIDQQRFDIDQVYTASNALQAKNTIEQNPIDILLCDIEMPQETGLDLLKWVRSIQKDLQCIFITCHADFQFAQQAMQLGCLDYLLKPVGQSGLEQCLEKAVDRIKTHDDQEQKNKICNLWTRYQPLVVESFWREILNHKTPSDFGSICQTASELNLEGLEEIEILPVLIHVRRWFSQQNARDVKIMEFGLNNMANELIVKDESNGLIIDLDHGLFVALIYLDNNENLKLQALRESCMKLIEACTKYLKCELSCYIGSPVLTHKLAQMTDELISLDHENLSGFNRVLTRHEAESRPCQIKLPDFDDWMLLLSNGETEKLTAITRKYFKEFLESEVTISSHMMLEIQHSFMQVFSHFMHQKGIDVTTVFKHERSAELFRHANRSIWDMEQWMLHNYEMVTAVINRFSGTRTSVEKAISYIKQNMSQDLTCEAIASHVYLNPIYLNRIFKNETGKSLMEYLLNKRLDKAKTLLDKTNMTVSSIAMAVGYSNFSYFSRLFRKHNGISPVGYRNRLQ